MAYTIGDIFIGHFDVLQEFGARPEIYSSRYPIRGHNGCDWPLPEYTMILSAADGVVLDSGFDEAAYGCYVKILHDGFLTLYAHLNDVVVEVGKRVVAGQLIAHSDTTGLTEGIPKLHFGIAPTDTNGTKLLKDNGYGGYIDPMGQDVVWNIQNLSAPVVPQQTTLPQILVSPTEYAQKSQDAIHLAAIRAFAEQNGAQITQNGANLAQDINSWIAGLLENRVRSDNLVVPAPQEIEEDEVDPILSLAQKHPLAKLTNFVVGFIWE